MPSAHKFVRPAAGTTHSYVMAPRGSATSELKGTCRDRGGQRGRVSARQKGTEKEVAQAAGQGQSLYMHLAGNDSALHAGLPLAAADAHTKLIHNGHRRLGSHAEHMLDCSLPAALPPPFPTPSLDASNSPWPPSQRAPPAEARPGWRAGPRLRALHGVSKGGASVDWRMKGAARMQDALCSHSSKEATPLLAQRTRLGQL